MDKKLFDTLYRTEEKYWWFCGQRFLIKNFIRKYYGAKEHKADSDEPKQPNKKIKILDIGCGTGINLQMLSSFGNVYGIDISDDAIRYCKMRKLRNVKKSDVMGISFAKNTFDVVTVFGVLYHKGVTDDRKAISEIFRVLRPGGRVFIFDAAFKSLFGKHTVAFDGIRRYSRKEMKMKLMRSGFKIEKLTYATFIFFLPVLISRKLSDLFNKSPTSDLNEKFSPAVNSLLKFIYFLELSLLKFIRYPFGVNIFAVARKPQRAK